MDRKIRELAVEAGFCFWEDESWRPKDAIIDWGSNYDEEFVKFYNLVVEAVENEYANIQKQDNPISSFDISKYVKRLSPRFKVKDCLPVHAGVYFWILKNGPRGLGRLNGKFVVFEKDHRGVKAGSKWAIYEDDEWQGLVK